MWRWPWPSRWRCPRWRRWARCAGIDPDRGISVDGLVLGAGAAALLAVLLGLLAVAALRSVRSRGSGSGAGSSAVARAAAAAGLPPTAVVGTRNALEPGSGVRAVPVRSALLGSVAAVTAVVAAVVFNASLGGLTSHPARYGWNWDLVIQAEAGYGAFNPGTMEKLLADEPDVTAWSEFSFAQLPVDGQVIPALGLQPKLGSVQPPTTSGHALSGPGQIELGSVTLRQLGKKVGDRIQIGIPGHQQTVVIAGIVTLPSFGVGSADHPSLGRGAMVTAATLRAVMGQTGANPGFSRVAARPSLGGGHRPGSGHHRGAACRAGRRRSPRPTRTGPRAARTS